MIAHLLVAALSALAGWWVLREAPEPDQHDDDELSPGFVKPTYRSLATARSALLVAAISLLLAAMLPPGGAWATSWAGPWAWSVFAGVGGVLAFCDQCTTYLPSRLLQPCAALVAVLVAVDVVGAFRHNGRPVPVLGMVASAALQGGLFWLLWRMGAGIGFGDVRLACVLGLVEALRSSATAVAGLLTGTMLGALVGVVTALWRRRHPSPLGTSFAYGPSLFLGAWMGLLLTS